MIVCSLKPLNLSCTWITGASRLHPTPLNWPTFGWGWPHCHSHYTFGHRGNLWSHDSCSHM